MKHDGPALVEIKRLARLGRIVLTNHALRRMDERGVTPSDVTVALVTATQAVWQVERMNWRVEGGRDMSGDALVIVVDIIEAVVVITVFG
jgi:hypothetical protein